MTKIIRNQQGERIYTVYRAWCVVNNKSYIGFDSKWPNVGRVASQETRAKITKSNTGKFPTAETRRKLSRSHLGQVPSKHNRQRTSETSSRSYEITNPDGLVFIINNLSRFCKKSGLTLSNMYHVAIGNRNHHRGWKCRSLNN